VYQMKVLDVDELHHQITAAYETVKPVMLQNTGLGVEYRLCIFQVTKITCGDLLRNIKTRKLSASFSEVTIFLSVLV
jgi:hypothetical protein